jgi:amino acid permease
LQAQSAQVWTTPARRLNIKDTADTGTLAGLIIGTGTTLKFGPASLLIGYVLMGFTVYVVMVALGEMGAWLPHKKSFSGYASRFVDPAMGFATGWNYFFKYVIVLPNNLTATGIILQYWLPNLNVSVWIVVFGVVIILCNVRCFHLPTHTSGSKIGDTNRPSS